MNAVRKMIAIGICGIVLGAGMSVFGAAPATARFYNCDQRIESMAKKADQDYKKGRLSEEDYLKVQAEIAFHKELWGC